MAIHNGNNLNPAQPGSRNLPGIETRNGRIRQKLELDEDLDPKVVYASFGWWFPEEPDNLFEWDRSNVNILFDTQSEEPATGTVEVRGSSCRVARISAQVSGTGDEFLLRPCLNDRTFFLNPPAIWKNENGLTNSSESIQSLRL